MRHGWLTIPGVQTGERTVEEQCAALQLAIADCKGKTILDLGCAEGLIGREFIRAGAVRCVGLEAVPTHISVALKQCKGLPMEFELVDLNECEGLVYKADIVLALNIAQKMKDPAALLKFAACAARELVLLRSGKAADFRGVITGKHSGVKADSHAIMQKYGFKLERTVAGPKPHRESVEYWRKSA